MITFKFILMVLLAVLPVLFTSHVKGRSSLPSIVASWVPSLKKVASKAARLATWLHEGMKRSDNFRKFFRMILIIVLLLYTWTEFAATDAAADEIEQMSINATWDCGRRIILLGMMADPRIILVCLMLNLSLFSDRWSNRMLTELHGSRHLQGMTAVAVLMICVISAWQTMEYFILAEVLYIILAASWAYPEKVGVSDPKGRKRLPEEETSKQSRTYRQAA